ncbi:hypothetical protein LK994_01500 [Ferruginibacter lapsinanis]|uniref:hypothetical protein n=1 Tax=Ferruginibacter lapsinanis TaxID=563172 RepID=UPI001E31F7AA|nr:hypothetical protein [Ferruginibacter lapsinanis]UEG50149.1 hypothetical protein LK994_01500 [Ferruginibacter lapsinanis]
MKNIFLLLVINIICINSFGQIQRNVVPLDKGRFSADSVRPDKSKVVGKKNKQIFKDLNLTKEQFGKLKEIRQVNKAKREAVNDNDALSAEEKRIQLKAINKTANDAIKAILSKEQWEKYQEEKKKKSVDTEKNMQVTDTEQ